MTKILRVNGAICYVSGMNIDGDGARKCYSPEGSGLPALDYLENAGHDGHWFGVVTDDNGNPIIQGTKDPAPGYFISPTSLQDKTKKRIDPTRYVDSSTVPYIAVAKDLLPEIKMGDLGMALHKGMMWSFIVADAGPKAHYGEGSIKLAEQLDIPPSPRNGGVSKGVAYIIFPGSTMGWPVDFENKAMELFIKWGGIDRVNKIFG